MNTYKNNTEKIKEKNSGFVSSQKILIFQYDTKLSQTYFLTKHIIPVYESVPHKFTVIKIKLELKILDSI